MAVRRWAFWFGAGVLMALTLQLLQVLALGGHLTSLISVGEQSTLRPAIEADLGPVTTVDGPGHDGQFSYLVARDPLDVDETSATFDHGAYRYRRILHPLLGGGMGLLRPDATLVSLALWSAIGMGLATAAAAQLGVLLGAKPWVVAGVLVNPGLWLSVELLTADALAIGLALTGVVLWLKGFRWPALALLALAALTKDQYLLMALGLAGWSWFRRERRDALLLAAVPAVPLLAWGAYLSVLVSDGFSARGNLTLFGSGIAGSIPGWFETGPKDLVFGLVALFGVLAALAVPLLTRRPLVAWLAWPWVLLAVVSSTWVWDLGNNAARAFAPALVVGALGVGLVATAGSQSVGAPYGPAVSSARAPTPGG